MASADGTIEMPGDACQDSSGLTLTPQQVKQWREAGYVFVNGVLPEPLISRLREQAISVFSKRQDAQQPGEGLAFPFMRTQKLGDIDAANEIPLHPRLLTAVSQLLGISLDQIMLGQAELWAKVGESAREGEWAPLQNQDQRMHMDYPNHYLTHPALWAFPEAVTAILYLDDIEGVDGGTGLVPRCGDNDPLYAYPYTMMPGVADIPWINDRKQAERHLAKAFPEVAAFREGLYPRERSLHYNTGSLLLYRYDLWHRGRPIVPSARRIVMNLAWRKRSCAHFITSWQQGWAKSMQAPSVTRCVVAHMHDDTLLRYEWSQPGMLQNCSGQFEAFVCGLSDTQRAALGFPPLGDSYWTHENISAVKSRYGVGFNTVL